MFLSGKISNFLILEDINPTSKRIVKLIMEIGFIELLLMTFEINIKLNCMHNNVVLVE